MLFAKPTIFTELQLIRRCTFVFGRRVVFALTLRTGQCYNNSHLKALLGILFNYLADDTGTHRTATFANGEPKLFFHGDRRNQFGGNGHVVTRHHHLDAFRQVQDTGHVRGTEIKLRPVSVEKRRMTSALFLAQNICLGLELGVRRNRTRSRHHLAALHFVTLGAPKQYANIVTRLTFVKQLAEHLHARTHRLRRLADTHDLDRVAHMDDAALHTPPLPRYHDRKC